MHCLIAGCEGHLEFEGWYDEDSGREDAIFVCDANEDHYFSPETVETVYPREPEPVYVGYEEATMIAGLHTSDEALGDHMQETDDDVESYDVWRRGKKWVKKICMGCGLEKKLPDDYAYCDACMRHAENYGDFPG